MITTPTHPAAGFLPWCTLAGLATVIGCTVPGNPPAKTVHKTAAAPATPKETQNMHAKPAPEALALPSLDAVRDQNGDLIDRSTVLGHWTVLWFYPAANTSG